MITRRRVPRAQRKKNIACSRRNRARANCAHVPQMFHFAHANVTRAKRIPGIFRQVHLSNVFDSFERIYLKRDSSEQWTLKFIFFGSSCPNEMIFGLSHLWGMKNILRQSGQQVLTKSWYWDLDMSKMGQKWLKRQQLPKKVGPFCCMGLEVIIFGWEVAQWVYLSLRKQLDSYLQVSWKYSCKHIGHFSHF